MNTSAPAAKRDFKAHQDALQTCAETCSDCQRECEACVTHCAQQLQEGQKNHLATLMIAQDCADICAAATQIMSRSGPFSRIICEACAEACARCASECEKFPNDS